MNSKISLLVFICLLAIISSPASAIPAFPGAEGWGAVSIGGRGGKVIEVTTLADAVPAPAGSLRACAEASGPRTCVFRVGGTIELSGGFRIYNPYLTIAGQTAPGGGILITGNTGIGIFTHDVIIRYLRFRLLGTGSPASGQVNIGISTGAYNVIVDHCSTSWSLDENMQIWRHSPSPLPDITGITVQRCVIAEGLAGHSTGLLIGGNADYGISPPSEEYLNVHEISVHHNLFVHNYDRNPRVSSAGTQVVNNVVYNWGSRVGVSAMKNTVDFINNYWKPGPMSGSLIYKHESTHVTQGWVYPDPSIYIAGNIVKGSFENPSADNWGLIIDDITRGLLPISFRKYIPLPQAPNPITIQSATDAYNSVLADAGANAKLDCQGNWVSNSDAVDLRVINDVKQGTGWTGYGVASPEAAGGFPVIAAGTPCADTDKDGMPDEWETKQSFNTNDASDNAEDADGDGYTNLEEYLNGDYIIPTQPTPPPTTPPTTPTSTPTPAPTPTPPTGIDTTPPSISNLNPQGTLPVSTQEATITFNTDETAACTGAYGDQTIEFISTDGTTHSYTVSRLEAGKAYAVDIKCKDSAGNVKGHLAQFSVAKLPEKGIDFTMVGIVIGILVLIVFLWYRRR